MRPNLKRIERAMPVVALLADLDPIYLPIFERIEDELSSARALEAAKRRTVRA